MESDSPQQDRLLYIGLCVRSVNGSEGPAAAARYGMPCCPAARQPERIFQVPCVFFFSAWTACRPHHSCCVGERRSATGGERGEAAAASAPSAPRREVKANQSSLTCRFGGGFCLLRQGSWKFSSVSCVRRGRAITQALKRKGTFKAF